MGGFPPVPRRPLAGEPQHTSVDGAPSGTAVEVPEADDANTPPKTAHAATTAARPARIFRQKMRLRLI
jgi:hypothetical protein